MKHLIKKASIDYDGFLDVLLNENEFSPDEVITIISENPDCAYNGEAYRALFFDKVDLKYSSEKFQDLIDKGNEDVVYDAITKDLIKTDGSYQSFSKSRDGVDYFAENGPRPYDSFKVIVKINASNALDISLLASKYENNEHAQFKEEEEILAKFTSDYEIVDGDELYTEVFDIVRGDEFE